MIVETSYMFISLVFFLVALMVGFFFAPLRMRRPTIVVAVGPYPDSVPMLMAAHRNYFDRLKVEIRVVDWSSPSMISEFTGCDFILYNKEATGELMADRQMANITYVRDLLEFDGFYVVACVNGGPCNVIGQDQESAKTILNYREQAMEMPSAAQIEVLRATLWQFSGKKIYAATTDVAESLRRLIDILRQNATVEPGPEVVDGNKIAISTTDAFRNFLNSGSDDFAAYTGGATERMLTRKKHNFKEILDTQILHEVIKHTPELSEVQIGFTQRNGFVVHDWNDAAIGLIHYGWNRALLDIQHGRNVNKDFLKAYQYLVEHAFGSDILGADQLEITKDDARYILKCIKFYDIRKNDVIS